MTDVASLEAVVRSVGGVLQLGGIVTVAVGIRGTRKELNRPGMWGRATAWLQRFRRRDATVHAKAIHGSVSVSDTVGVVVTRNWDGLDTDGKLDDLKSRIERLQDKTAEEARELRRSLVEQSEAISQERTERVAADRETAGRIEKLSGGNLRVEAWGAFFFAIGIALTTWAPEIARLLG